jgi:lycopene cyclase-like protein
VGATSTEAEDSEDSEDITDVLADVLILGAGPAALAAAAALCDQGVNVVGLAPTLPSTPWPNTYGIWEDELAPLGLTHLLGHRWQDVVVYVGEREVALDRVYGLLDNAKLQAHLLGRAQGARWVQGVAISQVTDARMTRVTTQTGATLRARLVIDASGHNPALLKRQPATDPLAFQAAYGVVGTFSTPPVRTGQLVLMDFRTDYLTPQERTSEPITFLYAMDLGNGRYFVEETSLAHAPALSQELLEARLHRRLAHRGIEVLSCEHQERVLFPMNSPMPDLHQPLMGYGGAASMVHPATGYQVGAALTMAPCVAAALAEALAQPQASPAALASAGWGALWPDNRLRRHHLYLFGLQNVLHFDHAQTQAFFAEFFNLPRKEWSGYLSNTLQVSEVIPPMSRLFVRAPWRVKWALLSSVPRDPRLLWRALWRGKR